MPPLPIHRDEIPSDELYRLLSAHCEGELLPDEAKRLEELFRQNQDVRRIYLEYMDLHASLQWEMVGVAVPPTAPPEGVPPTAAPPTAASQDDPAASPFGFLRDVGRQGWGFLTDNTLLFSVLAALLLAASAAIAVRGWTRGQRGQIAQDVAVVPHPEARPGVSAAGNAASDSPAAWPAPFAARLAAAECQWVDPELALGEGALLIPGQKLELASGRVEIVFQSGAEVKLHGPAIFEIQSANSGFLTIGRLTARAATPQSHGFTVHSRTAATVDLGTEFNIVASEDGHSQIGVIEGAVEVQLANGSQRRRLGVGESIEVEPGNPSVIARIEPGEGTPAFKFPTIAPPSNRDYADAAQGHAQIRVLRGQPASTNPWGLGSGPIEVLLDGKGQSKADSPGESFFFANDTPGLILLDLGKTVRVRMINTYSWHQFSAGRQRPHARDAEVLFSTGRRAAAPPPADGDRAAAGWTLIARVNTDEFFGFPEAAARPAQQAVSIAAAKGGPIGEFRYLLWDVQTTRCDRGPRDTPAYNNTFYGEFDVYAAGKD